MILLYNLFPDTKNIPIKTVSDWIMQQTIPWTCIYTFTECAAIFGSVFLLNIDTSFLLSYTAINSAFTKRAKYYRAFYQIIITH